MSLLALLGSGAGIAGSETLFLTPVATGDGWGILQLNGNAPTEATMATGWP